MQALGLIETQGLLPAIEGADVMLKTAQVEFVGRTLVGGGLVTITVTGDVGAVKAAVEAGVTAVKKIGHLSLVSHHVIPRPHQDIQSIVVEKENPVEEQSSLVQNQEELANRDFVTEGTEPARLTKESTKAEQIMPNPLNKEGVDAIVQEFGLEKVVEALNSLSVVKLRNLAREYKDLGVAGRAISKANKEMLIQKLKGCYERESKK